MSSACAWIGVLVALFATAASAQVDVEVPSSLPFQPSEVVARARASFSASGNTGTSGEASASSAGLTLTVDANGVAEISVERSNAQLGAPPVGAEGPTSAPSLGPAISARAQLITRQVDTMPRGARPPTALVREGSVERAWPTALERLTDHPDGFEQTWTFATAPANGSVTVRVGLSGYGYVATTATGLHFADAARTSWLRYGHGTWIDARGERTFVPAVFDGHDIVLRVPPEVVAKSAFPATLDPVLGAEAGVDLPASAEAFGVQDAPDVASDGGSFLVIWEDARAGVNNIYGIRVASDGTMREARSIPIAIGSGEKRFPSVAFDGTNFIVTWQDHRRGEWDVFATRITPGGQVLDPDGIPVSTAVGDQEEPEVARAPNGGGSIIVWEDTRTDLLTRDIYAARLSAQGAVLDPQGVVVCAAGGDQLRPEIASDGTNVLAVWEDGRGGSRDAYAARLQADATPIEPDGFLVHGGPEDVTDLDVAAGGGEFALVWSVFRTGNNDIELARVDTAGNVLDASPIEIATTTRDERGPSVAFDGARFFVAFAVRTDVAMYGTFVQTDGTVVTPNGANLTLCWQSDRIRLTFAGGIYFAVYAPTDEVLTMRFDATGKPLWPTGQVSIGGDTQSQAAVAFDGKDWVVAWGDAVGADNQLRAVRVSPSGQLLDTQPMVIATVVSFMDLHAAGNGQNVLLVWSGGNPRDVNGARIGQDGTVLDTFVIAIGPDDQDSAQVSSNGTDYFVVYEDHSTGNENIRGTRVTGGGTVLDPNGIAIATGTWDEAKPATTWDGQHYWVAWRDSRRCSSCSLYGERIRADGTIDDPTPLPWADVGQVAHDRPALAAGGGTVLLAWQEGATGSINVNGTRLGANGVPIDAQAFPIANGAGDQRKVSLAWDGTAFVAAWEDGRNGHDTDVYGARISPAGTVEETAAAGFPVSTEFGNELAGAVASDGHGSSAIAYSRFVLAPISAHRVRTRLFQNDVAPGAPCGIDAQCASGSCVDGICCDSPCAGGATDCSACSVAAGGTTDGTCTAIPACTNISRVGPPVFVSTPDTHAACSALWRYSQNGPPVIAGELPMTFSLRAVDGGELPSGLYLDAATGDLLWQTDGLAEGTYKFDLVATNAKGEASQRIEVELACTGRKPMIVGCDCATSAAGAPAALVAIACFVAFAWRARARRHS